MCGCVSVWVWRQKMKSRRLVQQSATVKECANALRKIHGIYHMKIYIPSRNCRWIWFENSRLHRDKIFMDYSKYYPARNSLFRRVLVWRIVYIALHVPLTCRTLCPCPYLWAMCMRLCFGFWAKKLERIRQTQASSTITQSHMVRSPSLRTFESVLVWAKCQINDSI